MPKPDVPDGWGDVVLSKTEARLYRWLCARTSTGLDYLHGRRVVYPPEHYATLGVVFAKAGARELRESVAADDIEHDIVHLTGQIMRKLSKGLQDAGTADEAQQIMVDRGLVDPFHPDTPADDVDDLF